MESLPGHPEAPPQGPRTSDAGQVVAVRQQLQLATQRLLGQTRSLGDPACRGASRLPGWSRAHVATHLARQADGLSRLVDGALAGERRQLYTSANQRDSEIEVGAGRGGVALHTDLSTSADQLSNRFDQLADCGAWDAVVELRGGVEVPAGRLPLARLAEVVLHHVDLDIGFRVVHLDEQTAGWLLEWCAFRLAQRADFPSLLLTSPAGAVTAVGRVGSPTTVEGPSSQLLGWLTGRCDPGQISGADRVLPFF